MKSLNLKITKITHCMYVCVYCLRILDKVNIALCGEKVKNKKGMV